MPSVPSILTALQIPRFPIAVGLILQARQLQRRAFFLVRSGRPQHEPRLARALVLGVVRMGTAHPVNLTAHVSFMRKPENENARLQAQ